MSLRGRWVVLLLVATSCLLGLGTAPSGAACGSVVDLEHASETCKQGSSHVDDAVDGSGDGHTYELKPEKCLDLGEAGCRVPRCGSAPNIGTWFWLLRDGQKQSRVCLTAREAEEQQVVTPAMVEREFRRLSWPEAELVVQPPNNRTLVNLPAVFSTELIQAQTQQVTLLGQEITIEARPVSYWWHSGAGEDWSTADPGQWRERGVDPASLNHMLYAEPGTFTASVDVTYQGRYRLGRGGWQEIPESLTVSGAGEAIEVVAATPRLVAPD